MDRQTHDLPGFIVSCENGWAKMPLRYANLILGSKTNLYRLVKEEGWFIPKQEARASTVKYLLEVVQGACFRIKQTDVKPYTTERTKWSKLDILSYLQSKHLLNVRLGFTIENLPDRNWLLSVLHTIEPSHEIFSGTSECDKYVDVPLKYICFYLDSWNA